MRRESRGFCATCRWSRKSSPEVNKLLSDDAIVATGLGHQYVMVRTLSRNPRWPAILGSGNLASMACGLPYANAAAIAYSGRQVVALVGDGGLSMLMAELATAAKYQLDVKIVVLKNESLGQIKWEQMAFLGNPEYGCDLHPIDFAAVATACGVHGYSVADPSRCAEVLRTAFSVAGPALVEAVVDGNEPPLPPKISFEQARHMVEALARGTADAGKIAKNLVRDAVRQLV